MEKSIKDAIELRLNDITLMANQLDMLASRFSMGDQISADTISRRLKEDSRVISNLINDSDNTVVTCSARNT